MGFWWVVVVGRRIFLGGSGRFSFTVEFSWVIVDHCRIFLSVSVWLWVVVRYLWKVVSYCGTFLGGSGWLCDFSWWWWVVVRCFLSFFLGDIGWLIVIIQFSGSMWAFSGW